MKLRLLVLIFVTLGSVGRTSGQIQYPPDTKNAALRYWIAFSEMQDLATDKSTQELLEKTLSGEAPWDEKKLAPILDANKAAIDIMQRATRLPECEWGLEYNQGSRASIAYAPRARALSRLNTLQGIRQLATGDAQSAINTWLAGVRFSQDFARGGSLIFTLMAKGVLLPNLRALTEATLNGKLTAAQQEQVLTAIRALPEDGFDWGAAWGIESATLEQFLHELQTASDPSATYEAVMGEQAPKHGLPPTEQDVHAYLAYTHAVQSALREPPEKAKIMLAGLESKRNALGDAEQNVIPNPQKSNLARIEIIRARTELLQALTRSSVQTDHKQSSR
jgi:hypothetical protein